MKPQTKPHFFIVSGKLVEITRQPSEAERMFMARTGKRPLLQGGIWKRGPSILNDWLHARKANGR